jgi:hypothetical protein
MEGILMNKRTSLILLALAYQTSIHTANSTSDLYARWGWKREKKENAQASATTSVQNPQSPSTEPIVVETSLFPDSNYKRTVQDILRDYKGSIDITSLEKVIIDQHEAEQAPIREEEKNDENEYRKKELEQAVRSAQPSKLTYIACAVAGAAIYATVQHLTK